MMVVDGGMMRGGGRSDGCLPVEGVKRAEGVIHGGGGGRGIFQVMVLVMELALGLVLTSCPRA